MATNPVLVNDLRKSLFRRKPVLAVAIMALIIVVLTLGLSGMLPMSVADHLSQIPLWHFPDLLLPVVVPAFTAGAFAKEYEQRTWQDVLLTQLRVSEILGGKFFAALLPTIATIIVLFPPFALLMIIQNVRWAMEPGLWMFVVAAKFFVSATFYIALVLVCSYYSANARAALVVSYVVLGLYAVLNYALWTFLMAQLSAPTEDITGRYVESNAPWQADSMHFSLTPVEMMHMFQSLLFGGLLLMHLALHVRRRS